VEERERGAGVEIRMGPGREMPPVGRKRKGAREKRKGEEREKGLSKDLCVNLENCRDLSVKHNFSLI
jgi:hypothetical protein